MDVKKLVSEMTLQEKASLLSGSDAWHTKEIERLGVPRAMVSDGPHGLRKQIGKTDNLGINESLKAVCFPSAAGIASSFDRDLLFHMGDTLGKECRAEDVAILLGPAINIKRSPLCGRNFEYLSEDPYLSGELAAAYIDGVQQNDVGVSVKHYAANNQETRRLSVSSEVDTRTLHEIYFTAFEKTVRQSKPWTLMCSYNRINDEYSSENKWLLTDTLRTRWGFDGFVMSDWGAVHDRVKGVKAGLELEMPSSGGFNDKKVVKAVTEGRLDVTVVDLACERLLNVFNRYFKSELPKGTFDRVADHQKAVDIATSSMVLLKNNSVLPLNAEQKIAFIGEFARNPRYQGGGSSHINPHNVVGAWEAVRDFKNVYFAKGYDTKLDKADHVLVSEAVSLASESDVAVVFLGLPDIYESEGYDRTTLDLPTYQNELLAEVIRVQKNVVVVLHNGSPVAMPWKDEVSAILESYLAGEGVGEAQIKLLFGQANPSGKLAETFPITLSSIPSSKYFPGNPKTVQYREGLYVGYRYFATANEPVLFPFGHGLSYTTFEYSGLEITGTLPFEVSFKIKNVGKVFGAEAAQVYVAAGKKTDYRAKIELKEFEKVVLEPGEETTVSVTLTDEAFRAFNIETDAWYVEQGDYGICIGASSEDIRLTDSVTIANNIGDVPKKKSPNCYYECTVTNVSDKDFEALLDHKMSAKKRAAGTFLTAEDTMEDARKTKWGKRIIKLARKFIKGDETVNAEMIYRGFVELPFENYVSMTNGIFNDTVLDGFLNLLNGRGGFRSISRMLFGLIRRR